MAVGLAVLVGAGALVRFWALGRQGLWYDEAVSGWLLRASPGRMLAAIPHSESTPPLYYLVAWGWVRVFGDTTVGLRALSALAGTATVGVAFLAGRALAGRRAGLIAAALVAVDPLLVWYSQEARAYALLVLLSTTSLWLLARVRARPTPGRLLAWALVAVLALATHYFAAFVVAGEALVVLAQRRAPPSWRLAVIALVGAGGAALVSLALTQSHRTYWFAKAPLIRRTAQIPRHFVVGFTPPASATAALVALAVATSAVVLLVVRGTTQERRGGAVAASVAIAGAGLPIALALAGADYLNSRNVIGALVPLAVLVAAGLGARRAGLAGLAGAALLVVVSVATLAALADDPLAQRPQWQRVAAALEPAPARHRVIILDGSRTWARPLGFYLPRTWWLRHRVAHVAEIDVLRRVATAHQCPRQTWWGALCDVGARTALRRPPVKGFRLTADTRVAGFAIARYRAPHPIAVRPTRRMLVTPTPAPVVP